MSVLRWVITDPEDTNPSTNTYTFPRNPTTMTSVFAARSVSSMSTTTGTTLFFEGATPPKSWQFSGPVLDKTHYLALHTWVYTKKRRLVLTDHFGRAITLVLTELEVVPKRRVNQYWSHDYTITGLIASIGAPTVGPLGPV